MPLKESFENLFNYVTSNQYVGYDPYDGLNSRLFQSTPLYNSRIARLCWIQFFKRCKINFRPYVFVQKGFNSKAGALFLLGNITMFKKTSEEKYQQECFKLFDMLKENIIERKKGVAWGYNFDWQSRAFHVPIGTPNIVTSIYVGNALLDFFEVSKADQVKRLILGIRDFILNEMILWEKDDSLCFAYIPDADTEVHNANLLAAAFLSRVESLEKSMPLRRIIIKSVTFSIAAINTDGHWPYGTSLHHRWMDNFHTAFNLEFLLTIRKHCNTNKNDEIIQKVFDYYINSFFLLNGIPRYYSNRLYPIDIHVIAEAILFINKVRKDNSGLFSIQDKERANKLVEFLFNFAINKFQDKRGYFYYQKNKYYMNRIPYMRWSQAWMFYALSEMQS